MTHESGSNTALLITNYIDSRLSCLRQILGLNILTALSFTTKRLCDVNSASNGLIVRRK